MTEEKELVDSRDNGFIQTYYNNLHLLYVLNGSEFRLVFSMLKKMRYGANIYNVVNMTSDVRRTVSKEIGVSTKYLSNLLGTLVVKRVIVRIGVSEYIFNPYIFWRGSLGRRQESINIWNRWSKSNT